MTDALKTMLQIQPGDPLTKLHSDLRVSIDALQIDPGLQVRAAPCPHVVADYAAAMAEGVAFESIVLFHDPDALLWVADGFQRIEAAGIAQLDTLLADVYEGSRRDALLYALTRANVGRGERLNASDQGRKVEMALEDEELRTYSDRRLAEELSVSRALVGQVRRRLEAAEQIPYQETTVGRDGVAQKRKSPEPKDADGQEVRPVATVATAPERPPVMADLTGPDEVPKPPTAPPCDACPYHAEVLELRKQIELLLEAW